MALHTDDLQSIKERYNYYERNDIIMYFWRESFKGSLFSERLFNLVPSSNKFAKSLFLNFPTKSENYIDFVFLTASSTRF